MLEKVLRVMTDNLRDAEMFYHFAKQEKTAQNEKGAQWFCDMAKSRMSQFHEAKKKAMEMTNDKAVLADAMMAATMQKADEIQWYMDKMR